MISIPNNLKLLYALKRSVRRSKSKYRFYHRQVEKERLRLVEEGACQQCVINYCNYLAYGNIKECEICESGQKSLNLIIGHEFAQKLKIHHRFNESI